MPGDPDLSPMEEALIRDITRGLVESFYYDRATAEAQARWLAGTVIPWHRLEMRRLCALCRAAMDDDGPDEDEEAETRGRTCERRKTPQSLISNRARNAASY